MRLAHSWSSATRSSTLQPRDTAQPLPELRADYVYDRVPCEAPHAGARLAALANALAIVAFVAGWIWIGRRNSTESVRPGAPDAISA